MNYAIKESIKWRVQSVLMIFILFFSEANQTALAYESLKVAVASNFITTAKQLAIPFEQKNDLKIQWISAASGTLFQQIMHGAPYDAFFSADQLRPQTLVNNGKLIASSLSLYAIGQLSLYSAKHPKLTPLAAKQHFKQFNRVAIANPTTAPYGKAAKQWLKHNKLWHNNRNQLILGINVNQTFQQTQSKAVDFGLVAVSQLIANQFPVKLIKLQNNTALYQFAGVLSSSKQQHLANKLINYFKTAEIQQQLSNLGYLPAKYATSHRPKIKANQR